MHVEHAVFAVGVGVDGDHDAFVAGVGNPGPVEVEAVGVGVELDGHAVGGAGVDDFRWGSPRG